MYRGRLPAQDASWRVVEFEYETTVAAIFTALDNPLTFLILILRFPCLRFSHWIGISIDQFTRRKAQ